MVLPLTDREGRLIELCAEGPADNMALDQAMLESVDEGGPPTLRLYQWNQPTLSLGYFQNYADRSGHRESAGAACVRRASGGGAILHHHELTYSIAWPIGARHAGASQHLYQATHAAVVRSLSDFGVRAVPFASIGADRVAGVPDAVDPAAEPFLCFQRRTDEDLIVSGYKVVGSAQRRGKRAVLQHGSLLVRASPLSPELPGVWDLGAATYSIEELAASFVSACEISLKVQWRPGDWTVPQRERAREVALTRFAAQSWLHRR